MLLYGEALKRLSTEPKIILNIIVGEHEAATSAQKREILCNLGDRLQEFDKTLVNCKEFMDTLNQQPVIKTLLFRARYLKMIMENYEEIKKRGDEIERGIIRLKIGWSNMLVSREENEASRNVGRQPYSSTTPSPN
ncbi:hypothetical protein BT96DRAFT_676275 [Gymnopus androsaceus JB14]|uniref:Uncharacterized protein n=1 Tax=Gymnopus androsaceus JB14 TaxID=1447944 RepID=A0A6A4HQ87_9AGAR|nr:hypothetical protein BT96DRAFT_676275 [Gymnopus androsaceus JB14]